MAKHVLQKLRFLCIPNDLLIDWHVHHHAQREDGKNPASSKQSPSWNFFGFQKWPSSFWFFWMFFPIPKMSQTWNLKKPDTQFSGFAFFSPDLCPFFVLFNMKRNIEKLSQNEQGHRNLAFWALCFSLWTSPVLFCFTIRDVKLSRLRELKFKLVSFHCLKNGS